LTIVSDSLNGELLGLYASSGEMGDPASPASNTREIAAAYAAVNGARSYLVDSASSHMLVSKIKPCMSKYMPY
jgi:hypothetical protein